MRDKRFTAACLLLAGVMAFLFVCPAAWADTDTTSSTEAAPQDIYWANTMDGADLALWRYRPDPESPLRKGAQPVILMPGMACNFEVSVVGFLVTREHFLVMG